MSNCLKSICSFGYESIRFVSLGFAWRADSGIKLEILRNFCWLSMFVFLASSYLLLEMTSVIWDSIIKWPSWAKVFWIKLLSCSLFWLPMQDILGLLMMVCCVSLLFNTSSGVWSPAFSLRPPCELVNSLVPSKSLPLSALSSASCLKERVLWSNYRIPEFWFTIWISSFSFVICVTQSWLNS